MKKTLKAQLALAIVFMMVAVTVLTGFTYAWFTASTNPEVGTISLDVKALDGLYLSANPTTDSATIDIRDWKTLIPQTTITGLSEDGVTPFQPSAFPSKITNVSNPFNSSSPFYKISAFKPDGVSPLTIEAAVAPSPTVTVASGEPIPGDYAMFSLWAKTGKSGEVYLDINTSGGSTVDNNAANTDRIAAGLSSYDGIKYTVRVGFVPFAAGVEDWANAVIWNPNDTVHVPATFGGPGGTSFAEADINALTGTTITLGSTGNPDTPGDTAGQTTVRSSADGKLAIFSFANDLTFPAYQKFNVYIWVEGADLDTVNAVANLLFDTKLIFGIRDN